MKRELRNPRKYQGGFLGALVGIGTAIIGASSARKARKAADAQRAADAAAQAEAVKQAEADRALEEKKLAAQQRMAFASVSSPASLAGMSPVVVSSAAPDMTRYLLLGVALLFVALVLVRRRIL